MGPGEKELRSLADRGPIVIFNISRVQSDAFLITSEVVVSLPLEKLDERNLQKRAESLRRTLQNLSLQTYAKANNELKANLEWLWDVALQHASCETGHPPILQLKSQFLRPCKLLNRTLNHIMKMSIESRWFSL